MPDVWMHLSFTSVCLQLLFLFTCWCWMVPFFVSKIYCPHSCVGWSAFLDSKDHFIPMSVPSLLEHYSISCPMVHSLSMSIQFLSHHPLCTLLLDGPLSPPLDQFLSLFHPIPSHLSPLFKLLHPFSWQMVCFFDP